MNAIIGIDTHRAYVPALDMFTRLNFEKPKVTLLHAANLNCPITLPDAHAESEYTKVVENIGLSALDAAVDEACQRNIKAKTRMVFGRAADSMIAAGKAEGTDLIAVGAGHCGRWSASYLDSATFALALSGSSSLLVTKSQPIGHRTSNLKIVLGIDHSAHSDQVIDKLIALAPRGVASILLLTAYRVDDDVAKATGRNPAALGGDIGRWLAETYEEKNLAMARKLAAAGYAVTTCTVEEDTNDAIRHSMQSTHADLLVIGSVGNSTEGASAIGSTALHQIGYEPYPVLMLRV